MRKYAQPRKSLPAGRDASLLLKMTKSVVDTAKSVAGAVHNLALNIASSAVPDGWLVMPYDSATYVNIYENGSATLTVTATCGDAVQVHDIPIFVNVESGDICPTGVTLNASNIHSDFNEMDDGRAYGEWPGDLSFSREYDVSGMLSGWGDIAINVPIGECGSINVYLRIYYAT